MWDRIASGSPMEFYTGMEAYDNLIPEGSRALLQLNLTLPVTQGVADTVENALTAAGIPDVKVTAGSPVLNIFFKKGFPWLPVIVGVLIPLLIALAIVVTSWVLYKEAGPVATSLTLIFAIGVLAIGTIIFLKRR